MVAELLTDGKTRATRALAAATGVVRAYCGWHIAPTIKETIRLDGVPAGRLILPTGKIQAVHAVTVNGVDVTKQIRWSAFGMIELPGGFGHWLGGVTVELSHGWQLEEIPQIITLVEDIAGRAGESAGMWKTETIGPHSVTMLGRPGGGSGGALSLFSHEKETLAPFRLQAGGR